MRKRQRYRVYASDSTDIPQGLPPLEPILPRWVRGLFARLVRW